MIVLAIDTAASLCAACLWDSDASERGRCVLDIGKGHAEHLMGVIDEALRQADLAYRDVYAIAVSVGPGSFTGVRVGVSTARGLALALSVPAIGISTLEALAAQARTEHGARTVMAALDGGRGEVFCAVYDGDGSAQLKPSALSKSDFGSLVQAAELDTMLIGSAIHDLEAVRLPTAGYGATADIAHYARLAASRLGRGGAIDNPVPLYLREADAKPQTAFALMRSDTP